MIVLTKIAETPTTITLGWDPPVGVGGYVFYANGQAVSVASPNNKDGSPRKEVKFSKTNPGPPFQIAAVCRQGGIFLLDMGTYSDAPPPTDAYFISDWSTGKIGWEPWATIFQMGTPSTIDVGLYGGQPRASSDDGRVKVIPNPYGQGNVLQCEIRNSDPPTGANTFQKAEVGSYNTLFPWRQGMEMWVVMDLYLPDDFGLASGGTNGFTNIADLHPSSNSGVPALGLGGYSTTNLQLYAGIPGSLQRKNYIPLDAAHRNRKLELLIGAKLATSGGWCEAWLDGQNVIPRFSAPMAEASESGPYWKQGLYKEKSASFPNGGSRILFGRTLISDTRPF